MRIVVCVKEVMDPDAVNNYAVAGRLEIGADGKSLTQTAIPRLMNGYDEQAIEAALRLRDAGADFTLAVISAGSDPEKMLKHAAALGAEELISIQVDPETLDHHAFARLLAAQIKAMGGADLVLCGIATGPTGSLWIGSSRSSKVHLCALCMSKQYVN